MAQQRTSIGQTFVSVIIPTLNEEHFIGDLLRDLAKQSCQPDQVFVVDGNSTDATVAVVQSWQRRWKAITLIHSTVRGVGAQRDLGGRRAAATSNVLYFLDADVRLPKQFLEQSIHQMALGQLEAACPRYQPLTTSLSIKAIFSLLNFLFWFGQKHFPSGAGPCMIVSASRFKQVGGFNTKLLVDDLDFVHRAGATGQFAIIPESVFVSVRRFKQYGIWKTFWQYLQVSWHFVRKTPERTNQLNYEFGKFKQ